MKLKILIIAQLMVFGLKISYSQWIQNGFPGVSCLAANDSVIFAGTANGVQVSNDNGNSWQLRNNGLINTNISSINYYNSKIYVGTGGDGIYVTENNGFTWNNLGLSGLYVLSFAINNEYIIVETVDPDNNYYGILYVSNDLGNSWNEKQHTNFLFKCFVFNNTRVIGGSDGDGLFYSDDFCTSWTQSNLNYFRTYSLHVKGDTILAGGRPNGLIFYSTDNGVNWTQLYTGLSLDYTDIVTAIYSYGNQIIIGLSNDYMAYLSPRAGIIYSGDDGSTWHSLNAQFPITTYPRCTSICPINNNLFFGTNMGIFTGFNETETVWNLINEGLAGIGISCSTISDSSIVAGTYMGVLLSSNNGKSWKPISNGLNNNNIIESILLVDSNIYVGTIHNDVWYGQLSGGIYCSHDLGNTWNSSQSGIERYVSSIVMKDTNLFCAQHHYCPNDDGGISISTDNGDNWSYVINGLPEYTGTKIIGVYYNKLFTGLYCDTGIYYSTDNGLNWYLDDELSALRLHSFFTQENEIFIGTSDGVFRSGNYGIQWEQIGLSGKNVLVVTKSPNGNQLFASVNGEGFYFSLDYGTNWNLSNAGNNISINSIGFIDDKIIIGTNNGFYQRQLSDYTISAPDAESLPAYNITSNNAILSAIVNPHNDETNVFFEYGTTTNYGLTIEAIQNPLNGNSNINTDTLISNLQANTTYHFRVKASNSFGTTYGSDLSFTTNNLGIDKNKNKSNRLMVKCFPNPSSSEINILFNLPENCYVSLNFYNQTGNKIQEEAWTEISAGEQKITLPLNDLANGIYFYSLYAISVSGDKSYKASGKLIKQSEQ